MDEVEKLKKQVDVLERKLALYEKDATYRAFYSLNRIVNLQVDYLNKFDLVKEIGQNPKEDKVYDRAKGLWESLKTITSDLKALKSELGLDDDEEERERVIKNKIITSESMANVLGNSAGQQS